MSNWYKAQKSDEINKEDEPHDGVLDTQLLCCGYPENRRKDPYKAIEGPNYPGGVNNEVPSEKTAQVAGGSLIDRVQVAACSGGHLVILINGTRYEYSGVPGSYWNTEIDRWKKWANKHAAGQKLSNLIRSLERYRVQDHKQPLQPKISPPKQPGLFDIAEE